MAGLDDARIVNIVQQTYYPDLDADIVAQSMGAKMPEPAPAPPPERSFWGTVADTGLSLVKGATEVPQAAVGLADMATGGRVGKALEDGVAIPGTDAYLRFDPKAAGEVLDSGLSAAQQAANKRVQSAEGIWNIVKEAVKNPSVIYHSAVESLPSMLGGGVIARGAAKAPLLGTIAEKLGPELAPLYLGAFGEGVVGAGQAAEQIRTDDSNKDRLLTGQQSALAGASGAADTLFGILGGKIAHRLGIADVDTMIAGAATNPKAAKHITRQVLEGFVSEGALEELPQSIAEQVAQNLATGKPIDDGVSHAAVLGLLTGGLMGGGANLYSGMTAPPVDNKKPPPTGKTPAPPAPPTPGPADVMAAGSVDEAVNTALRATGVLPTSLTGTSIGDLLQPTGRPDPLASMIGGPPAAATEADPFSAPPVVPAPAPLPPTAAAPLADPFAPGAPNGQSQTQPVIAGSPGGMPAAAGSDAAAQPAAPARVAPPAASADSGAQPVGVPPVPAGAGQQLSGLVQDGGAAGPAATPAAELPAARAGDQAGAAAGPVGEHAAGRPADGGSGAAQPVTPEHLALQLARAEAAHGEVEGKIANKHPGATAAHLADAASVRDQVQQQIAAARAANPADWAAYDQRQAEVAKLEAGDPVQTPDGPGKILNKFKRNWRVQIEGVGPRLLPPGALTPIAELTGTPAAKVTAEPPAAPDSTVSRETEEQPQPPTEPGVTLPGNKYSETEGGAEREREERQEASTAAERRAALAKDKGLREAFKSEKGGNDPHISTGMAGQFIEGWQHAKAGTELMAAKLAKPAPGMLLYGFNPVDSYLSGYMSQKLGHPAQYRTVRTEEQNDEIAKATGAKTAAAQAAEAKEGAAQGMAEADAAIAIAEAQQSEQPLSGEAAPVQRAAGIEPGKAAPIYAQRKVLNGKAILAWAKEQGFQNLEDADKLHVTIAFSRDPVDPGKVGNTSPAYERGKVDATANQTHRSVVQLGDQGAIVLKFASPVLQARFQQFKKAGASWDFEGYQPHVTLSYSEPGLDVSKVIPYAGMIELGPELQEPLDATPEPKEEGATDAGVRNDTAENTGSADQAQEAGGGDDRAAAAAQEAQAAEGKEKVVRLNKRLMALRQLRACLGA